MEKYFDKQINNIAFWIGLLFIIAGFIYEIQFAGIPYQDAPTELTIQYERNHNIANWIMSFGLILITFAFIYKIINRLIQHK